MLEIALKIMRMFLNYTHNFQGRQGNRATPETGARHVAYCSFTTMPDLDEQGNKSVTYEKEIFKILVC